MCLVGRQISVAALRCIGNLVSGTDDQTQVAVDCGAAPAVAALLLHTDAKVRFVPHFDARRESTVILLSLRFHFACPPLTQARMRVWT